MLLALFQCIFVTGAGACLYKTVRHFADQKIAWIAYGFYFILGGLSAWIIPEILNIRITPRCSDSERHATYSTPYKLRIS